MSLVGDIASNSDKIIQICQPDSFYALLCSIQLYYFAIDWEGASAVIFGMFVRLIVPQNAVKFRVPRLNRS